MSNLDLHVKYRPKFLDEVIGQDHVVKSLKSFFDENNLPHAFLFLGNSGCGKTTLARIIANQLGTDSYNIFEIDAATHTGVDDWREIADNLRYPAMGKKNLKFVIIDECHMLSKGAWNSLLKIIEEPPPHVYFAFCTTESGKVPETIETRCHTYTLKDVKLDDLMDLVDGIASMEGITLPEGAGYLIAKDAGGSPRKALVKLSQVRKCSTKEEVIVILESLEESTDSYMLCKLLIDKSVTWGKIMPVLKNLKEANAESLRIQVVAYLTSCVFNCRTEREAERFLNILDCFKTPIYQATGMAQILLNVAEVIYKINRD